ncbi:MAG: hypothetical protein ACO3MB_13515 [Saprospiraceae bacterium]
MPKTPNTVRIKLIKIANHAEHLYEHSDEISSIDYFRISKIYKIIEGIVNGIEGTKTISGSDEDRSEG